MPLSKQTPNGAGAIAPAFLPQWRNRFLILVPVIAAIAALSWQAGIVTGQLLGQQRLRPAHEGLPALESLSQQAADALHEQGVCLDAPAAVSAPAPDTVLRIDALHDRFAILTPCLDLAIAQNDFETLQISSATVSLIQKKQALTTGFVTDSLAFRREKEACRIRRANSKSLNANTKGKEHSHEQPEEADAKDN